MKNNNTRFIPFLLAICLIAGIAIGTFYANHFSGNKLGIINTSSNKLNALLRIIDDQYVDTVNMGELVEEAMPQILSELDPHSSYIPAKDLEAVNADLKGTDSLTREQLAELPREGGLPVAFLWLGIALIIMPVATRMVVDNATVLANYFAISELTMGLTAIAIGTSLPELATAIAGVRKGENDIAVGNIIGANIFNIVIVLGLPALITPGEIDPLAYSRDYSVMLLVSIIFALLCWRRSPQPGRGVGVLLTGGFIVWLAMLYWLSPILVE